MVAAQLLQKYEKEGKRNGCVGSLWAISPVHGVRPPPPGTQQICNKRRAVRRMRDHAFQKGGVWVEGAKSHVVEMTDIWGP